MRNRRTTAALVGAIILFLITSCLPGTAAANSADRTPGCRPGLRQQIRFRRPGDHTGAHRERQLDKIFSFQLRGPCLHLGCSGPLQPGQLGPGRRGHPERFLCQRRLGAGTILGNSPADVAKLIKATYPKASADDRPGSTNPGTMPMSGRSPRRSWRRGMQIHLTSFRRPSWR